MKRKVHFRVFFMIVAGMMYACHPDKNKKIDPEPQFSTSDASELFFKNVRQSYYDKFEMKEAKLEVYRIKERMQMEQYPLLQPAIVVNWRYDEAYLLLEPNATLQGLDSVKIIWEDTVAHKKGYYVFANGNKADHYRLATSIYNSIQDRQQLYVLGKDNQKQEFLHKATDREAFRKTLFDYYRLVNLI